MDNTLPSELMDIEAVARVLGVSKKYVYANHKYDFPPAIKIGNLLRWRPADVQRWIDCKMTTSGLNPLWEFRGADQ